MAKIMAAGGEKLALYAHRKNSAPKDPRIGELLDHWQQQKGKKENLLWKRGKLLEYSVAGTDDNMLILVQNTVYRRVEMIIGKVSHRIAEDIPGGRFLYDPETHEIKYAEL